MNFETNNTVITFSSEENLKAGDLVKITGNYSIEAAATDEAFDGVVVSSRDDIYGVALKGIASVTYTGELNYGDNIITCSDSVSVKKSVSGKTVKVLDLDESTKTATILF